jgi:Tfp pilus assembly protein PilN
MIRTNLSTRPFYNERAIHMAIAAAALVVLALTIVNVVRIVTLSRQNTEFSRRIDRDQSEAEQRTKITADVRRGINHKELQLVVDSAREANALIDQRTFSWTAFFNRIESTIPPDVMLSSVRPTVKDGMTRVSLVVLARRNEDIDEFMEKLEATGAFEDIVPSQQDRTESGLFRVLVESIYTGAGEEGSAR